MLNPFYDILWIMVVSIGDAIIIDKNSVSIPSGFALQTAIKTAASGKSASFLGGISKDLFGSQILNSLIDNLVLFDPVFCASPFPTAVFPDSTFKPVESLDSYADTQATGNHPLLFKTALSFIDKEKLTEAFSQNSDIDSVVFGGICFANPVAAEEILTFLKSQTDKEITFAPCIRDVIRFQVLPEKSDLATYKNNLKRASALASSLILTDDDKLILGDLLCR